MTEEDFIADTRRQEREYKNDLYFTVPRSYISDLNRISEDIKLLTKRFETRPLRPLFSSLEDKERAFEECKDFPNNFYDFKCFGIRITIIKRGKWYFLATFGFYPQNSKLFDAVREYSGKYAYYNRTDDLDYAVKDWYLAVSSYLVSIGVNISQQQVFEFDSTFNV